MGAHGRPSGIRTVGDLSWGAHICEFYESAEDLLDLLVPYMLAGLAANEECVWITSDPLHSDKVRERLSSSIPDLSRLERSGQLEIRDHPSWYGYLASVDPQEFITGWIEREQLALSRGRDGLRFTGTPSWVSRQGWDSFAQYEKKLNQRFASRRIIAACCYDLNQRSARDMLDLIANHSFALARRQGEWTVVENASLKASKDELKRLNDHLDELVRSRTADLRTALQARDAFLSLVSHELKTPITTLRLYIGDLLRANERSLPQAELG